MTWNALYFCRSSRAPTCFGRMLQKRLIFCLLMVRESSQLTTKNAKFRRGVGSTWQGTNKHDLHGDRTEIRWKQTEGIQGPSPLHTSYSSSPSECLLRIVGISSVLNWLIMHATKVKVLGRRVRFEMWWDGKCTLLNSPHHLILFSRLSFAIDWHWQFD